MEIIINYLICPTCFTLQWYIHWFSQSNKIKLILYLSIVSQHWHYLYPTIWINNLSNMPTDRALTGHNQLTWSILVMTIYYPANFKLCLIIANRNMMINQCKLSHNIYIQGRELMRCIPQAKTLMLVFLGMLLNFKV